MLDRCAGSQALSHQCLEFANNRLRARPGSLPDGPTKQRRHRDLSPLAAELSQSLLAWWEVHGRKDPALKPWMFTKDGRWPEPHEHLDVLECWIAEVMLQQTQLQVVLPYWQRWMQAFPTLTALAEADEQSVLLRWQGLGYYSRAPAAWHGTVAVGSDRR